MARDPKSLTVDYKTILKMLPSDRATLASSGALDNLMSTLTPSQMAALFPKYYMYRYVDTGKINQFDNALSGGAAGGVQGSGQNQQYRVKSGPGLPGSDTAAPVSPSQAAINAVAAKYGVTLKDPRTDMSNSQATGSYKKILDYVADSEGANYNTQFGYQKTTGGKALTDMTIAEVMSTQTKQSGSSAIGRYQFMHRTLQDLINKGIVKPDDKFSPETQDRMATYLIDTKRHGAAWRAGKITDAQFGKYLSQEFASIPNPETGRGYYGGQRAKYGTDVLMNTLNSAKSTSNTTSPDSGQQVGGLASATATGGPATPGSAQTKKTVLISMGSNDKGTNINTYENTLNAINAAKAKGYNVVIIPPKDSEHRRDEVLKAAQAAGAGVTVETDLEYGGFGGYHLTDDQYKKLAEKYKGADVFGDSLGVGIRTGGNNLAVQSLDTNKILPQTNALADVSNQPGAPPVTGTPIPSISPQVMEEIKKNPELAKIVSERPELVAQLIGTIAKQNKLAPDDPKVAQALSFELVDKQKKSGANAPTAAPVEQKKATKGFEQNVAINDDVMKGKSPFISGHDFAVPVYTKGTEKNPFDESLSGLTPQAIERLKQDAIAAKAAGVDHLVITGAQSMTGHASHGAGTEFDIKGVNADGSTWTKDQRALTSLGAIKMGGPSAADRAGFYPGMTLHEGKTNEVQMGPRAPGAWGPGEQTQGVPLASFQTGMEKDIAAYLKGQGPMPNSPVLDEHLKRMNEAMKESDQNSSDKKADVIAAGAAGQPVDQSSSLVASSAKNPNSATPDSTASSASPVPPAIPAAGADQTNNDANTHMLHVGSNGERLRGLVPNAKADAAAAVDATVGDLTANTGTTGTSGDVPQLAKGGTVKTREDLAAINIKTGQPEFMFNSGETVTVTPGEDQRKNPQQAQEASNTIELMRNKKQMNQIQATKEPELFEKIAMGYTPTPGSFARATNRAKQYEETSTHFVNGHFM
jgi:muramidase (phage lysozyme)